MAQPIERTMRTVGEREKTAGRLLKSSATKFYDAEVDIDWDAPVEDGKLWMSPHRVSLHGTKLWAKLTPEQRAELGKHEIVSILSFGIFAEAVLSTMLFKAIIRTRNPDSDHVRYALTEIGEETRHSTMFSRLIGKTGLKPYPMPTFVRKRATLIAGLLPTGPASWGSTLLIEELLDRGQREMMHDESLQPHLRMLMKIHVLEEARHITYAREELVRMMDQLGPGAKALNRVILALAVNVVFPLLVNPKVYRSVGVHPLRGFLVAFTSEQYVRNTRFLSEPMLRFFHDAGMIEGRLTRALYRLGRTLPDDVRAAISR